MQTLQNPRHETFALSLAQGASPEAAYHAAGFSDSNRKARARELAQDPDIAARVAHLKSCLPHIESLRDRFAPSILLMPQTHDEMKAWLWQVMNGTRKVLPLQLRAANLFIRLHGWHLLHRSLSPVPVQKQDPSDRSDPTHPSQFPFPSHAPIHPTDEERHLLAHLSQHTIANDLAHRPVYPDETRTFYSTMADLAGLQAQSRALRSSKSEGGSSSSYSNSSSHASRSASAKNGPQLVTDPSSAAPSSPVAACSSEALAKDGPQLVPQDKGFQDLRSAPAKDGSTPLPSSAAQSSSVGSQLTPSFPESIRATPAQSPNGDKNTNKTKILTPKPQTWSTPQERRPKQQHPRATATA